MIIDGEESLWKFSYDCFYSVKQEVLSPAKNVDEEGGLRSWRKKKRYKNVI